MKRAMTNYWRYEKRNSLGPLPLAHFVRSAGNDKVCLKGNCCERTLTPPSALTGCCTRTERTWGSRDRTKVDRGRRTAGNRATMQHAARALIKRKLWRQRLREVCEVFRTPIPMGAKTMSAPRRISQLICFRQSPHGRRIGNPEDRMTVHQHVPQRAATRRRDDGQHKHANRIE